MPLRIILSDGAIGDTKREFPDDVEKIKIGRNPDCAIRFEESQSRVAHEHCVLRRHSGEYRLEMNSRDRVFLNGKEAHDNQVLPDRSKLRLGLDGPELQIE